MRRLAACLVLLLAFDPAAAEEAKVLPPSDDRTERVPLHTVVPAYPSRARRDRIEGDVQVCFHVDREGEPYRIAVRRSTHRIFEKPAMQAVRTSRFASLAEGETDSGIKTCRTFRFRLTPVTDKPVEAQPNS